MRTSSFICTLLVVAAVATAAEHGQRTRLQRLTAQGLLRQLDLLTLSPQHGEPLAGTRSRQLSPLHHIRTGASSRTNPGDAVHSDMDISVLLKSQCTEVRAAPPAPFDTVYEVRFLEQKRRVYTYDAEHHLVQVATSVRSDSQWSEMGREVCTYAPEGQLLSRITYYNGGINQRQWYAYDSEGRQTSGGAEWFDRSTGDLQGRVWYTTAFDPQGNKVLYQYERWSISAGSIGWRLETTISDSIEVYTLAELTPTGWLNTSRSTLRGNPAARPLEILEERWNNTRWINQNHCLITFDAQGRIVYSLDEQWKDKDWAPTARSSTFYGPDGNSWHSSTELWDRAGWVQYSQIRASFDEQGRQILQLDESWADGWIPDQKWICVYSPDGTKRRIDSSWSRGCLWWTSDQTIDPSGNQVIYEEKDSHDGELITGGKQWWTYTPSGREAEVVNAWWRHGVWETEERYLFSYDGDDRLHSLQHYDFVGGDWILSSETRSDDGALSRTGSWHFGDGDDQTMDFHDFTELTFVYRAGVSGVPERPAPIPTETTLRQNFPNPFNPTTTIPFSVSAGARTSIAIFDVLGREIARPVDEWKDPGEYKVQFDAAALASGMYICRFASGDVTQTQKLMLVR
jgi:hypothetical protein